MLALALVLAGVWGVVWAVFLQWHGWGRWLAVRRTWLSVVVGVGGDLLILGLVVDWQVWLVVAGVVAASSIGMIVRSLYNERHEDVG
jgi:hypothetical protein